MIAEVLCVIDFSSLDVIPRSLIPLQRTKKAFALHIEAKEILSSPNE
jgi:hypothetical protein